MYPNHICSLVRSNQLGLGKSRDASYKKSFSLLSWFQISIKNPRTKFYFRSIASIQKEQRRQELLKNKFILHPFSMIRLYYECIFVVIDLITLYLIPRTIMCHSSTKKFHLWDDETISDIIHVIDFVLNFFTGYYNSQTKIFSLKPIEISRLYVQSHLFYYDLLMSFPFYLVSRTILFTFFSEYMGTPFHGYIRVMNLMTILRLKQFLKYYNTTTEIIHQRIYLRFCIKSFLLICLCLHWMTCFYCIVITFSFSYIQLEDIHFRKLLDKSPDVFIIFTYPTMYYQSLFIVVSYLLGVNLTNMAATYHKSNFFHVDTTDQLVLLFIYSLFGYIVCQTFLIVLLQIILSMNHSETKYYSIIAEVKSYTSLTQIPNKVGDRILMYYNYRFRQRYFREDSINKMLSDTLCREIYIHSCRQLVESIPILQEVPNEILSELIMYLEHEIFLYNDIIYKTGVSSDYMYFILSGTVAILTPTGKELSHLHDGNYFGMTAFFSNDHRRIANAVAIEISEVYKLHRRNFRKCFPLDSPVYNKLAQISQERYEKILLLDELHKKYLSTNLPKRKNR